MSSLEGGGEDGGVTTEIQAIYPPPIKTQKNLVIVSDDKHRRCSSSQHPFNTKKIGPDPSCLPQLSSLSKILLNSDPMLSLSTATKFCPIIRTEFDTKAPLFFEPFTKPSLPSGYTLAGAWKELFDCLKAVIRTKRRKTERI